MKKLFTILLCLFCYGAMAQTIVQADTINAKSRFRLNTYRVNGISNDSTSSFLRTDYLITEWAAKRYYNALILSKLDTSAAKLLYQPLENQRLSTTNTPSFLGVSIGANGLLSTVDGQFYYMNIAGSRFLQYNNTNNQYILGGDSLTAAYLGTGIYSKRLLTAADTVAMLTGYVRKTRLINTTAPLLGGGSLAADLTLSIDTGRAATKIVTGGTLNKVRDSLSALIPTGGFGTVTSVATNNGTGITGGTITGTGTLAIDTLNVIETRKRADSLAMVKVNIADTLGMLNPYLRKSDTASMLQYYVNNTAYGTVKTGKAIGVDTLNIASKQWVVSRQYGTGTVTSVGLALPSIFNVTTPTVTTNGILTAQFASQLSNVVLAGPVSGGANVPSFRGLVQADIPAIYTLYTDTAAMAGRYFTNGILKSVSFPALTGDITTTIGSIATTLKNTGTAGTYGSATQVPVFTTDAQGRVTTVTNTSIQIAESQVTNLVADLASKLNLSGGTMTGSLVLAADATLPMQAVTKNQMDQALAGLSWKPQSKAATTANITLSGTQTIDGIAIGAGDTVLVKNQTTASQNGYYIASASAWSRATWGTTGTQIVGSAVYIRSGGQAGSQWANSNTTAPTVGTDPITFSQVGGPGTYAAGTGLNLTGNVFSNTGVLSFNTRTGAVVPASGDYSFGQISGLATNAQLTNSSVTVTAGTGLSGGGSVALGSSVTLTNAGVLSLAGTANQITASASTGNITLSIPSAFTAPGSITATTSLAATENGNVSTSYALYLKRNTDASPVGYLIQAQNAAANTNLFTVDVNGSISGGSISGAAISGTTLNLTGTFTGTSISGTTATLNSLGLMGANTPYFTIWDQTAGGILKYASVSTVQGYLGISTVVNSLAAGTDINLSGTTGSVTISDVSTLATVAGRGNYFNGNIALNSAAPAAWGGAYRAIQVGLGGTVSGTVTGASHEVNLGSNIYLNNISASWTVLADATYRPTLLQLLDGGFQLYNGAPGAVGSTVTLASVFNINSSGTVTTGVWNAGSVTSSGAITSASTINVGTYITFNQTGVRSWNINPVAGELRFSSGDGLGNYRFDYNVYAASFNGAGTGLTGTASSLNVGGTWQGHNAGDFVDLTSAQTISGAKTFSSTITISNAAATQSRFLYITGSTTSATYMSLTNTTGSVIFGVESSAGGNLFPGTNAYSSIYGTVSNTALQFATNNILRYTIDASGNNTWTGSGSFGGSISVVVPFTTNGSEQLIINASESGVNIGGIYALTEATANPIASGLSFKVYKQNVGLVTALTLYNNQTATFASSVTAVGLTSSTTLNVTGASTVAALTASGAITANGSLVTSGNISAAQWTTSGVNLKIAAATYTDNSTAASTTVATNMVNAIGQPTLAATNTGVVYSDAATLSVAGAPVAGTNVTITRAWAIDVLAGNVNVAGSVTAGAGFFNSDLRKKDVISTTAGVGFNTISFHWKDKRDNEIHYGYAAQEVQKILPGAVMTGSDGYLNVNYGEANSYRIMLLEKEIQELKELIKSIKK